MNRNFAIVHETDERMFYLKTMLKGITFKVPTHVFAPNVVVESRTLTTVEDGAQVFCARATEEGKMLANSRDITLRFFNDSERFQAQNSRFTAEGALEIIIEHSKKSIGDCYCLILGFGRTGAALAKILGKLDVAFDLVSTSSVRPAHAFAKAVLPIGNFDFAKYDVVVNTVPSPIVSDKELMSMQKDCVYIDLASRAAINLDYAKHLGIDADVYPALPAKTCPVSAAKAMFDYIMEVKV